MLPGPDSSLSSLREALHSGACDPIDVVESYLRRIEALNPSLNALVYLDPDRAREAAHQLVARGKKSDRGPLWGLPSADKDLVARAGMPTGYGSRVGSTTPRATRSDPMARWLDDVGAISVGKTSTSEYGMSGATEALATGPTRNPYDLTRSAGGSSGGAACAVAAGMLPFAPGSDGGGSLRIPAFSCGVVGWKPSRGSVPAASGLDSPFALSVGGLITRTAADLASVWDCLWQGERTWSTTTWPPPRRSSQPLRVAVSASSPWSGPFVTEPSEEAHSALELAISTLTDLGHHVLHQPLHFDPGYPEAFFTAWAVSAAMIDIPGDREDLLEPLTRWLREKGRAVTAVELGEALVFHRRLEASIIAQMHDIDVVLTPGLRTPPPVLGWYDQENPERNFAQQVEVSPWTSFVNVAGLPALALPTSSTEHGIPMGVQLVGKPGTDGLLIALAEEMESALPAFTHRPGGWDSN